MKDKDQRKKQTTLTRSLLTRQACGLVRDEYKDKAPDDTFLDVPEDLVIITLHCLTGSTRVGVCQEASVKIEN